MIEYDLMEEGEGVTSTDVPQRKPLSKDQVLNTAGGYVWKADDWTRLKRYLCLGTEGGTYYVSAKMLEKQKLECIHTLIKEGQGEKVVSLVREYSVEGRVAKQDSILLVLAMCARSTDLKTKTAAYGAVRDICRIPTFLFQFIDYCEELSKTNGGTGWGRAHRKAVSGWYNAFVDNPKKLAMLVTKYRCREQWTHRDVLRLAHVKPANDAVGFILRFVAGDLGKAKEYYIKDDSSQDSVLHKIYHFLEATEQARHTKDEEALIKLIQEHHLVREHCPTGLLDSLGVWKCLLQDMPMTAMIRNLGKMSTIGLLREFSSEAKYVAQKLVDEEALAKARIHPFTILNAKATYTKGKGNLGKLTWDVNKQVTKALDDAFYLSFKFVEPTGKRYLLALDVSGSMSSPCLGSAVSCYEAAAAMLMVCLRKEPECQVMAFSHKFVPLPIKATDSLETVLQKTRNRNFGSTNCSLPMTWAAEKKKKFDVFVVYTDNETYSGNIHPSEALRQYRKVSGIWDARLIVVAMNAGNFSIADPEDPGMMDVAGFDSSAPEAMRSFIVGDLG